MRYVSVYNDKRKRRWAQRFKWNAGTSAFQEWLRKQERRKVKALRDDGLIP